ncbi:MAG: M50 family metallopeptidase [Blastocatellia bacterium]
MAKAKTRETDARGFLLAASLITVILNFIPGANLVTYPFRLFVTFIHEAGHAVAALLTFGMVEQIFVHQDASGETYTRGGLSLVISSAGYLASTFYGASMLLLNRDSRMGKTALALNALGILGLTILYVRGAFGFMAGMVMFGCLMVAFFTLSARGAHFLLSFLAVQCCLNAVNDLRTLFFVSAVSNMPNDASTLQRVTGIPAVFWAMVWLGISVTVLALALKSYDRRA